MGRVSGSAGDGRDSLGRFSSREASVVQTGIRRDEVGDSRWRGAGRRQHTDTTLVPNALGDRGRLGTGRRRDRRRVCARAVAGSIGLTCPTAAAGAGEPAGDRSMMLVAVQRTSPAPCASCARTIEESASDASARRRCERLTSICSGRRARGQRRADGPRRRPPQSRRDRPRGQTRHRQ